MKPTSESMIGLSRTVRDNKTTFVEYAQIKEQEGEVAYIVTLGHGAAPVRFKLIRGSDREVVFENPTHDFPQRIIYKLSSSDELFARIEGRQGGTDKGIDYHYKRSSCL